MSKAQPKRVKKVKRTSLLAGLAEYGPAKAFDEMAEGRGRVRRVYEGLRDSLQLVDPVRLAEGRASLEASFLRRGITFTVYNDPHGTERIFPFDPLPRLIPLQEWTRIEKGLVQRVTALNLFLQDVYGAQKILQEKWIPAEIIHSAKHLRREAAGLKVPHNVYIHICGTDLIRGNGGEYMVLEDNGRCPSGVSYVLENRRALKQAFPEWFRNQAVRPVDHYGADLLETLREISPRQEGEPVIVLLTPGPMNSAYFEHSFLARQTGIELVQGCDLFVEGQKVFMRTTRGPRQVDVIYRRIDDDFLDPLAFRKDSVLGVPGLLRAVRAGQVSLANAIGTGVADDKALYAYVPKLIRHYLGEDASLPNVPTFLASQPKDLKYILQNMAKLVVKPTNESGGYGLLIGPQATKKQIAEFRSRVRKDPRNYIAQPVIALSTHPTICGNKVEPRHIDLRPFVLTGKKTRVLPGGLTRVALRKGSLVVNSSQGGGSKDTWVLDS
jgi:uncharacterized circularly permuted ATP-grasp superfamily protein